MNLLTYIGMVLEPNVSVIKKNRMHTSDSETFVKTSLANRPGVKLTSHSISLSKIAVRG
jgi:hypothetical protein